MENFRKWKLIRNYHIPHKNVYLKRMVQSIITEEMKKTQPCWFLTSNKLSWEQSNQSWNCWRNCGKIGTMIHMWWECPVFTQFWQEVLRVVITICKINIFPVREQTLLNIKVDLSE